jgi:TolB protein
MRRVHVLIPALSLVFGVAHRGVAQRPAPPFIQSLAWSPDGRQLVLAAVMESWERGFQLYVLGVDGGAPRELDVGGGQRPLYPVFVRNDQVAFGMTKDSVAGVWVVNVNGTGLRKLVAGDRVGAPSFSPDGRRFAFNASVDGKRQVIVASTDGTGRQRVSPGAGNNWNPQWSPDGQRIAYYSDREGGGAHDTIYVANADGTDEQKVTPGVFPTWTPDGRIVFSDKDGEGAGLFIVNADGSGRLRLVRNAVYGAMSPDGAWIALVSYYANPAPGTTRKYQLELMRADGSGRRALFPPP